LHRTVDERLFPCQLLEQRFVNRKDYVY
jgi:hypothetical protein